MVLSLEISIMRTHCVRCIAEETLGGALAGHNVCGLSVAAGI